jgi:hypothetical protein
MIDAADIRSMQSPGDVLRLEFVCTPEERNEAQSLVLTHTLGGGSTWRATAKLLLIALGIICFFLMIVVLIVPRRVLPYAVALCLTAIAYSLFKNRGSHRKDLFCAPVIVELSASGVLVDAQASQFRSMVPWGSVVRRLESESLFVFQSASNQPIFVIPKRLLPSRESIEWLRERKIGAAAGDESSNPLAPATRPKLPPGKGDDAEVTVDYRLGYWNCADLSLASWASGRFVILLMIAGFSALSVYNFIALGRVPNPKFSRLTVVCCFMGPGMILLVILSVFMATTQWWLTLRRQLKRRTVRLRASSITFIENGATSTVPWTVYTHFKETPWSFLAWRGNRNWLLLPKSAFSSIAAQERCRELFARHLKPSTWFFGN